MPLKAVVTVHNWPDKAKHKRFGVVKLGFAELCSCGASLNLEEVFKEIHNHTGWESMERLKASIRIWAEAARAGDFFCTRVTAIICRGRRR